MCARLGAGLGGGVGASRNHRQSRSFYIRLCKHGPYHHPLCTDKGVANITSNDAVSTAVDHRAEMAVDVRTGRRSLSLAYDIIDLITISIICCLSTTPLVVSFLLELAVMNVVSVVTVLSGAT